MPGGVQRGIAHQVEHRHAGPGLAVGFARQGHGNRLEHAPLGETIAQLAASVSDSDPRFDPVSLLELPDIDIDISVLTPERAVTSLDEIEIGRHGVIVELGARRGLLLPQVATEQRWDRETFVSHACLKASLPRDAWRHGAQVLVFEAQVFGELDA